MCMKYRAICFDFDYTLGDSTDSIVAGFQYGFTRLGSAGPRPGDSEKDGGLSAGGLPTPCLQGIGSTGAPGRLSVPCSWRRSMERQRPGDHSVSRCPGAAPGAEGPGDAGWGS